MTSSWVVKASQEELRHPESWWWLHLSQRRSQDEQVTWVQHGHTQCGCNTHLLGDLGHMKNLKIIHSEITSEAICGRNTTIQTYLYVLAIAHANNWSLTLAFYIIFTRAPANLTWVQAGCSYTTDISPKNTRPLEYYHWPGYLCRVWTPISVWADCCLFQKMAIFFSLLFRS